MVLNFLIGVEFYVLIEIEDMIFVVRVDKDLWGEGEIDCLEFKMVYVWIKIVESLKKLMDVKYKL